jgi:FMN phosphatase YigB (HAD superfamily)
LHFSSHWAQILYVGDEPEPDIIGAQLAGLQPVWITYIRDQNLPFAPCIVSGEAEEPDVKVPRIFTLKDLLSLLDKA